MPYNAPFHGKFKLIVNLAIGGNFFQDNMNSGVNCVKTPWDDIEKGKLPSVSFLENMPKWFNWGDTPYKYEDYVENAAEDDNLADQPEFDDDNDFDDDDYIEEDIADNTEYGDSSSGEQLGDALGNHLGKLIGQGLADLFNQ